MHTGTLSQGEQCLAGIKPTVKSLAHRFTSGDGTDGNINKQDHAIASGFGNSFIGGWFGFWQSVQVMQLVRTLLWDQATAAYENGWGEEVLFSQLLQVLGDPRAILDLSYLRNELFQHRAKPKFDLQELQGQQVKD